jgi:predicted 3-demethylubiquinone-9 3-methyltransferase (glyoxalase superfamily)
MQVSASKIMPCLWFDGQAEEAAEFYASLFPNSRITSVSRYPAEGQEIHGQEAGRAMSVGFELDGRAFLGLNGGPQYTFTEAVSFQVYCDDQAEVDHYWNSLTEGGSEGPCGWLKDKFGLSWQVVPKALTELMSSGDAEASGRVMKAMMQMKKLDIAALQQAAG